MYHFFPMYGSETREREREREGQDEMREEMERRRFWFYLCATFDIGLYMYWLYKSMEYI